MGDAVGAVVEYLQRELGPSMAVYGVRLPRAAAGSMPRKTIVVRGAGGGYLGAGAYMPTIDERIDVRSYGVSAEEARALASSVSTLMHVADDERLDAGRIMWCQRSGGPTDLAEPDTGWPFTLTSWQVYGDWLT